MSEIKLSIFDMLDITSFIEHTKSKAKASEEAATASFADTNSECGSSIKISPLENLFFKLILEQTIDKIVILNHGFAQGKYDAEIWQGRQPLKVNFQERIRSQIFFLPTIETIGEALLKMIDVKIKRDADYARLIFHGTVIELQEKGTYESLQSPVKLDKVDEEDEIDLIRDYVKNKHKLQLLEKKLATDIKESEIYLNNVNEKLKELESQLHDCKILNAMKTRIVEKWERTRFEQEEKILLKAEKLLTSQFDATQGKILIENRAINDIENYIKHNTQTIDELTAYWMEKYDTEIEQLDDDIQITKENISDLILKNKELLENYNARQKEMDEYWEQKRLEQEQIELAERKWKSAIKIQAWWRGTMVRRHLGPYRKKKRGKGKGGKDKKGKKNK